MYKKRTELQTQAIQPSKANPESPKFTPSQSPNNSQSLTANKKSSGYSRLQDLNKLWKQSSLSLTRDCSPSHKIPNSIRFKPLKEQEKTNKQFLALQLRQNIKSDRSINFAKSHRPEHWVKGLGEFGPSPASYKCERFMQDSHYKSVQMKEAYKTNPLAAFYEQKRMKSTLKGQSFKKFEKHHKTFLEHTKHRFYQPQNIEGQPGPGQYTQTCVNKPKAKSYSIRTTLKRFNDNPSRNPGPGTYDHEKLISLASMNIKETIPRSKRDYLTKFEDFPSPNHYAINRFLEEYT